ncbi:hypothetical protein [Demequina litorisediminis]|uniref:Uncharacterized protein n=1 Tax=Demequina litorisediminis TaxID=1849022 RepID=A0ABQ6IJQ9_9MICO|nr:hypothetical protein [Demequina litorisediminis]GMA36914.1 hypothetical protein GCM10025876_31180 [Demequina litorisediminis]
MGDGSYGAWQLIEHYTCATDPLYEAAINAWRSMEITPTNYETQPDTGYAITTLGIIPIADDSPRTRTVTLLGTSVHLRATPTDFTWSADGDTWTTTDPGTTHANGGTPLTFDAGERRIHLGLTTTWTGQFSLNNGNTWIDAPGTATTTSPSTSIHLYSPRARLVDCDLNGTCTSSQQATNATTPNFLDPDADGTDNYTVPDNEIDAYLAQRQ